MEGTSPAEHQGEHEGHSYSAWYTQAAWEGRDLGRQGLRSRLWGTQEPLICKVGCWSLKWPLCLSIPSPGYTAGRWYNTGEAGAQATSLGQTPFGATMALLSHNRPSGLDICSLWFLLPPDILQTSFL